MRLLVCGSRTYGEVPHLPGTSTPHERTAARDLASRQTMVERVVLDGFQLMFDHDHELTIIEGGARGADTIASVWAETEDNGVEHERFDADWRPNGVLDRGAGPRRNQQMLDEGKPNLVVAFVDRPLAKSKGTLDMVTKARRTGVPVVIVEVSE